MPVLETSFRELTDAELIDELREYINKDGPFNDEAFSYEPIKTPVITPQGHTYEKDVLQSWLRNSKRSFDPLTNTTLNVDDLLDNNLFRTLYYCFEMSVIPLDAVYEALLCPLSNELLENPVVAQDGNTYSADFIKAYLEENKNKLPNGLLQTKPLYPNVNIRHILDAMRPTHLICALTHQILVEPVDAEDGKTYSAAAIEAYLREHDQKLPNGRKQTQDLKPNLEIETQLFNTNLAMYHLGQRGEAKRNANVPDALKPHHEKIETYLHTRIHENKFAKSFFGWRKWPKLYNATLFKKLLEGTKSREEFTAQANAKVYKQGRLGKVTGPALQEYNTQKFGKS